MFYRFKFKKEYIDEDIVYRPKIKVTLSHGGKSKEIIAVLDTGSDLVYIPRDMADYFGLPLSKGKKTAQGVAHEFTYHTTKINVKIEHPHRSHQVSVTAIVPEEDEHQDIILGTEFLQDFIVTLDYPQGTIKLTENTRKGKK
jgi:predicted aspartyl protease